MDKEQADVQALFEQLTQAPLQLFPGSEERVDAPKSLGVYIIYDPEDRVLHVGRTVRAKDGIYQRLNNHLRNESSFTTKYLNGDGSKLRLTHGFRCLVVEDARQRALLEAYAVGSLCPAHLGLGN